VGGGGGGGQRFPICGSEFVKGLCSLRIDIVQDQVNYSGQSRVGGQNQVAVNLAVHKGKRCLCCATHD